MEIAFWAALISSKAEKNGNLQEYGKSLKSMLNVKVE